MTDTETNKTVAFLNEKFGEAILGQETQYDFSVVTVQPAHLVEILNALYTHPDFKYQYLTTLGGIHYPLDHKMAVFYQLHSLTTNQRIRIKIYISDDQPKAPSVTSIFKAANWLERETYDFYGILFEGHPDLRRILNVDDMIFFPMRKEFPLEDQTREDKADEMFGR
jgi:NADH-quinone oxidoreductase subunit C